MKLSESQQLILFFINTYNYIFEVLLTSLGAKSICCHILDKYLAKLKL